MSERIKASQMQKLLKEEKLMLQEQVNTLQSQVEAQNQVCLNHIIRQIFHLPNFNTLLIITLFLKRTNLFIYFNATKLPAVQWTY